MKFINPLKLKETIKLLRRLKSVKTQYPADLLSTRRTRFINEVKARKISIKESKLNMEAVNNYGLETVLQVILVGMVSILIVVAAYTYRDELYDLFLPNGTEVPIVNTVLPHQDDFLITPLPSATHTATSTPVPSRTEKPKSISTETRSNPISTPTNPGLHLGQTKTPKPTKTK